jgi:hypothetical protein
MKERFSSSLDGFRRIRATPRSAPRNRYPNTNYVHPMETKYRTLLQAVALVALFAAAWLFQQPGSSRVAESAVHAE